MFRVIAATYSQEMSSNAAPSMISISPGLLFCLTESLRQRFQGRPSSLLGLRGFAPHNILSTRSPGRRSSSTGILAAIPVSELKHVASASHAGRACLERARDALHGAAKTVTGAPLKGPPGFPGGGISSVVV